MGSRRHPREVLTGVDSAGENSMVARASDRVDRARLWRRLMELAERGATPAGGVCRLALSEEEIQARALLRRWAGEVGLAPAVDEAGNLFLRLPGRDPALAPVLTGSHIDTQPTGGKFDGAYGVVAAVEALQAIVTSGHRPRRSIDAVAWMNEEGSRFAPGMMGSAVFTAVRAMRDIEPVADRAGVTVRQALDRMLDRERDLERRPLGFPVHAFMEAHIEQGPLLEAEAIPIGVVTGIQGKRTYRVTVDGEASHAGTTPRRSRRDALVSAVAIVGALQRALWDEADEVRFTIGMFTVTPNAPSVVPAKVVFSVDLRHDSAEVVEALGARLKQVCTEERGRCDVRVEDLLYDAPLAFPQAMREQVARAAADLGLRYRDIASPAGHDSRYLHYYCPTGMLFIPCRAGISHNEAESITVDDAWNGARVLADVLVRLADAA